VFEFLRRADQPRRLLAVEVYRLVLFSKMLDRVEFLPRDARSARAVFLSWVVSDVDVPWACIQCGKKVYPIFCHFLSNRSELLHEISRIYCSFIIT